MPIVNTTTRPSNSFKWPQTSGKTDRTAYTSNGAPFNAMTQYSENIYPLKERNGTTYANFTVPGGDPYCLTCILAWNDIDALLTVEGCPSSNASEFNWPNDETPSDFYKCEGTWRLVTTARLATWQQTYGYIEVWEVDDEGLKDLQWTFEFQWNETECVWNNTEGQIVECDVLPLTTNSDRA